MTNRQTNRDKVREMVRAARSAFRRLNEYGVYSKECWAFEQDYLAKSMDAIDAFRSRNDA